ncbi:MAG: hypothetical protein ACYC1E_17675 [Propionibacteriaceae bacterium]
MIEPHRADSVVIARSPNASQIRSTVARSTPDAMADAREAQEAAPQMGVELRGETKVMPHDPRNAHEGNLAAVAEELGVRVQVREHVADGFDQNRITALP